MSRSRSVALAAVLVSVLSIGGKLLGFVRSVLVAAAFGTGADLDAFLVAFFLPTLLPTVLSGVMTTAYVPYFVSKLTDDAQPRAWSGANAFLVVCVGLALLLGIAGAFGAESVVGWVAPGLAPRTHELAVSMTRAMMPLTFVMAANSILQAIAQCSGRYAIMSFESVLLNVAMLLSMWLLRGQLGVWSLVLGAILGFALNLALLIGGNWSTLRRSVRWSVDVAHPGFRRLLADAGPYLVSYGGTWASALIGQAFVSGLDAGAISALSYASLLAFLPLETIGNAVLTVSYPELCRHIQSGDGSTAWATFARGVRYLVVAMVPAAIFLLLAATPVVATIFQRHAFTAESTATTAGALSILAIAVVPRSLTYLAFRALVAMSRRWTQILVGLGGVALNITLCVLLVPRWGLTGSATATTAAACLNAVVAFALVLRVLPVPPLRQLLRAAPELMAMMAIFALIVWAGVRWPPLGSGPALLGAMNLAVTGLVAAFGGLLGGLALQNAEARLLWGAMRRILLRRATP